MRQITAPRSTFLDAVARFRQHAEGEGATSIHVAQLLVPIAYAVMIDRVEVAVAEQPLPRLQTLGSSETPYPFLYDIEWDVRYSLSLGRLRAMGGERGAPVRLRPGAADKLIRLAPLLRPLIELHWVRMVASINGVARVESSLHDHLFGKDRLGLPRELRDGLADLQGGRCFYCSHDPPADRCRPLPAEGPLRHRRRRESHPRRRALQPRGAGSPGLAEAGRTLD